MLTEVLDGGEIDIGNDMVTVESIAGLTPTRTVDIDTSRPEYAQNTRRLFSGRCSAHEGRRPSPMSIFFRSWTKTTRTSPSRAHHTHYDYNPFYLGVGSTGIAHRQAPLWLGGGRTRGAMGSPTVFEVQSGGGLLPGQPDPRRD